MNDQPTQPTAAISYPDHILLAADRIRHYVAMRDEMPFRQSGDIIHGIHAGTKWEAELLLSDIRAILEVLP
jgi:hypothetical protein